MEAQRLIVTQAHSALANEREAVAELRANLQASDASLVLFFCSPRYNLATLGRALAESFVAPLAGCTSAGQIGANGYVSGGITALSLTSRDLRATPYLISPLAESTQAAEVGYQAVAELVRNSSKTGFGLLFIDGISGAEERVTAALFEALGDVPLVGGSAADDLTHSGTFVYHEGEFLRDAAVFVLVDTTLPFATFKVQHVNPTSKKLVVTHASAEERVVFELNGKPAAAEYARSIGIDVALLDSVACAEHPLLLSVAGQHFVRGIRGINADGSLAFACAVEAGLVLTLGEQGSPRAALEEGFSSILSRVPAPAVVLGFDCVSRRQEFERRGEAHAIGDFLAAQRVFGFCTYGEQLDSLHMNQTFTAVALGG